MVDISNKRISVLAPHLIDTPFKEEVVKYMTGLENGSSWLEVAEETCTNKYQLESGELDKLNDLFGESLTTCLKDGVESDLTRAEMGFFLNNMWKEIRSRIHLKEFIDIDGCRKRLYLGLSSYKK